MNVLPLMFLLMENEDDRAFLESVYTQFHRLMYAQALQILRSREAAEDAVSDSLLALTKKISLLRTLEWNKLRAYVVITVKHTALTQLKRGKRETLPGDVTFEQLSGQDRVDDRLLAQAGIESIKNAIRALPPREKEIMLMKYFRGLSDQEIGEELGLRAVSVRVHLTRARQHLAQALAERGESA